MATRTRFSPLRGRENRDKYRKEGHTVEYMEVAGLGHLWATKADVNEAIWKFFAAHPLNKKTKRRQTCLRCAWTGPANTTGLIYLSSLAHDKIHFPMDWAVFPVNRRLP